MKRLWVSVAAIVLVFIMAAGIAVAAATTPGTPATFNEAGGTKTAAVNAEQGNSAPAETRSTFGQHGFCDQDDYDSPASY